MVVGNRCRVGSSGTEWFAIWPPLGYNHTQILDMQEHTSHVRQQKDDLAEGDEP